MGGETTKNTRTLTTYPIRAAHPVGKQIHGIYRDRLGQFTSSGQYETKNLLAMMDEGRVSGPDHIKLEVYSPPDLSRPTFENATSQEFKPAMTGESFGPSWSTHWFKVHLKVPSDLSGKEHLELHWDGDNEALIWSEDGEPLQGLTGGGERVEWILPKKLRDGKWHKFYVEMACNGMFGNAPGGDSIQPPKPDRYFRLHTVDIVAVNLEARALHIDFWIIGDAAREFPEDSWQCHEAQQICNAIVDAFVLGQQSSIIKGREIAQRYLGKHADSAKVYDSEKQPIVYAIGHCHIDTCWLWPWAETKRKVARSWANQCDLMDRYPEHRFACSQAQQYKWLEQLYPSLYDRVKTKVKKGTFQPIGGSWVEHDTNMPSGESLVRQFLFGQRFFESRFGERCTTFWLPDTFGYSSQLPQLCRQAGMTRFFTQKLSWNNINKFPHTTFNWVALDGSQVLCHMTPAETYTAEAHFGDVKRSVSQHKSMDQDSTSLLVFGKGDGGGGPTFQHLDKLRRCRGLSDKVDLLPRVKMGESVDDFFARLEKKAAEGTEFVTWFGELYFELHRGTYTTQANNKRNNRQSEIMLHDVEYLATLASLQDKAGSLQKGYPYPKKEIDEMWEKVLLCQFHDCLPGSSIEMCYDDSDELYAEVFSTGHKLLQEALGELGLSTYCRDQPVYCLNTLPWSRTEVVALPCTTTTESTPEYQVVNSDASCSFTMPGLRSIASVEQLAPSVFRLSNADLTLVVSHGTITSLYDIASSRELIPPGRRANQYVLFDDKPLYWQAWDVEVYHLSTRRELDPGMTTIHLSDPLHVSVITHQRISSESWIITTISLDAATEGQPSMVSMSAEVEWRESMQFLKVEFPVDIRNTEASYETQFGIVRRPTHYNTSWDMAKFEVCTHKFADLSESTFGVSILNDSKYGFATCGDLMRLSLLRAPKAPDANADMGRHHIRWAILPHAGSLGSLTVRAGFNFNNPMKLYGIVGGDAEDAKIHVGRTLLQSLRLEGDPGMVLDTVKRGEDDMDVQRWEESALRTRKSRCVVVRIYDSLGGRCKGWLHTGSLGVKRGWRCNLLEDEGEKAEVDDQGRVRIELGPFEVGTWRLEV